VQEKSSDLYSPVYRVMTWGSVHIEHRGSAHLSTFSTLMLVVPVSRVPISSSIVSPILLVIDLPVTYR
jgi:hypothetical protein